MNVSNHPDVAYPAEVIKLLRTVVRFSIYEQLYSARVRLVSLWIA